MQSCGTEVYYHVIPEPKIYVECLKDKLIEEACEVKETKNLCEIKEKLADILEVVHALCLSHDLSFQDIENIRIKKKQEKGGFEKRIYSDFVAIDPTNPNIDYCLSRPKQNPEINISFKSLSKRFFPYLQTWLLNPDVINGYKSTYNEEEFSKKINSKRTKPFIFFLNNIPVGYIQFYYIKSYIDECKWIKQVQHLLTEKDVGLDLFVGEDEFRNKGFGKIAAQEFIRYIKTNYDVCDIFIDPAVTNVRAMKYYKSAGFVEIMEIIDSSGSRALFMKYENQ